jgi:kynureninase
MAAIRASLNIFIEAGGMQELHKKTITLKKALLELISQELDEFINKKFEIITPLSNLDNNLNDNLIGNQISLKFYNNTAKNIHRKLLENNIIVDYREPEVLRIAAAPLYNKFSNIYDFIITLKKILIKLQIKNTHG